MRSLEEPNQVGLLQAKGEVQLEMGQLGGGQLLERSVEPRERK
jgi:hypothetical protein